LHVINVPPNFNRPTLPLISYRPSSKQQPDIPHSRDPAINPNLSDSCNLCSDIKIGPTHHDQVWTPTGSHQVSQQNFFVEMSDLLPDTLTSAEYNANETHNCKPKHLKELSVMEWVISFAMYMAVISHTKSQRIADLLGYQQRIIHPSYNHQPGRWAVYDCQFRLKASVTSSTDWLTTDLDIWNNAFPDEAWLKNKNATKRAILSPVGLLQHATKVFKPSRMFVSQMYATAARASVRHLLEWSQLPALLTRGHF